MIKQLFSVLALSTFSIGPAFADLTRVATDRYTATDSDNNVHTITYVRKDFEGDVQLRVTRKGQEYYYWVSCKTDSISIAGDDFDGWNYVDHRKMEGYYSDVACRGGLSSDVI